VDGLPLLDAGGEVGAPCLIGPTAGGERSSVFSFAAWLLVHAREVSCTGGSGVLPKGFKVRF
jgi:hypothetical protein